MSRQSNEIFLDIMQDATAVPNGLLRYYRAFKLDEDEVVFLITLLRLKAQGIHLLVDDITGESSFTKEEVSKYIPSLVEKGFITLNKKCEIKLNGLYERLREAWGWQEAKERADKKDEITAKEIDIEFSSLYQKFQEEFGRPLSPIEGEQIKDWFQNLNFNGELIYEALKKAVLLDKLGFRYIGVILEDWHRKGVKTLIDIETAESKSIKNSKNQREKKKKYRQDQESNIFDDDIFEVN